MDITRDSHSLSYNRNHWTQVNVHLDCKAISQLYNFVACSTKASEIGLSISFKSYLKSSGEIIFSKVKTFCIWVFDGFGCFRADSWSNLWTILKVGTKCFQTKYFLKPIMYNESLNLQSDNLFFFVERNIVLVSFCLEGEIFAYIFHITVWGLL